LISNLRYHGLGTQASLACRHLRVLVTACSRAGGGGSVVRHNPAEKGAVTGDATYASFLSSLLTAGGRGGGLHFC